MAGIADEAEVQEEEVEEEDFAEMIKVIERNLERMQSDFRRASEQGIFNSRKCASVTVSSVRS